LPAGGKPRRESKLAWVNSVCILFSIGILGARRGMIAIKPVPPIQEIVPVVVVQPVVLPPQAIAKKRSRRKKQQPRVLVALPNAPNVNFGVPTVGSLVVPAALASAPPLEPMRRGAIGSLNNTGAGGERPEPPYPPIARKPANRARSNSCSAATRRAMSFPWT
jgi:hypothetical protein